jgi:hypothetical protein
VTGRRHLVARSAEEIKCPSGIKSFSDKEMNFVGEKCSRHGNRPSSFAHPCNTKSS